jgi:hypothetical protein
MCPRPNFWKPISNSALSQFLDCPSCEARRSTTMDSSFALVLLISYLSFGNAYLAAFPDATPAAQNAPHADKRASIPAPTPGPALNSLDLRNLFGRQYGGNPTCGWVEGNAADAVTCNAGYGCGYDTNPAYAMCCSTDTGGNFVSNCPGATTCFEYLGW